MSVFFFFFTIVSCTIWPWACVKKVNRFDFDFMLSSERTRNRVRFIKAAHELNVVCICIFSATINAGIRRLDIEWKKTFMWTTFQSEPQSVPVLAMLINGWVYFEAVMLRGVDTWLSWSEPRGYALWPASGVTSDGDSVWHDTSLTFNFTHQIIAKRWMVDHLCHFGINLRRMWVL